MHATLQTKISPYFQEIVFRDMLGDPIAKTVIKLRLALLDAEEGGSPSKIDEAETARNKAYRAFLADTSPKIVMFCGSRNMDDRRIYEKALFCLGQIRRWYQSRQWSIICGDAIGVDTFVVKECLRLQLPLTVYGVQPSPRIQNFPDAPNIRYIYLKGMSYSERDTIMAQKCSYGLFFWNGSSRGTHQNYLYTSGNLQKPALLIDPSRIKE